MPTPISKIADVVLRGSTSETLPELSNFNNIHWLWKKLNQRFFMVGI